MVSATQPKVVTKYLEEELKQNRIICVGSIEEAKSITAALWSNSQDEQTRQVAADSEPVSSGGP